MPLIASCGHEMPSGEWPTAVRYKSWECDPIEGFVPAITHASYCAKCAAEAERWPEFIPADVSDDDALDAMEAERLNG